MGIRFFKPQQIPQLFYVLSLAAPLSAQSFSSLAGTVSDPSGAVIPKAAITLESADRGLTREAFSDTQGRYGFPQVLPGRYRLRARAAGFTDTVVEAVRLAVNTPATVDIHFTAVGTVTAAVSVSAEALDVNTTDATVGNAITTKAVLETPLLARNVAGLLAFQPGVTQFSSDLTDGRNGAVNGGRSDQANVTLDGVDVNDQQNRYAFTSVLRVTPDSVEEFRATTSNANADQGRSSGAQISLVTKSGTNNLHGSLYGLHRNTKTAANSFFNNLSGVARPALLIDVFRASVGGPIRKGKLFFFANYEGRRDASALSALRTVPSLQMREGNIAYQRTDGSQALLTPTDIRTRIDPAGIGVSQGVLDVLRTYPAPNDFTTGDGLNIQGYRFTAPRHAKQDTYISRFDYVATAGNTLFARANLQNDHTGGIPQFPGDPPQSVALDNSKGLAFGWNSVLRPNFISTTRYGFTRQGVETTGIQSASLVSFRNLDSRYAQSRGLRRIIPVHHITQDFDYSRGNHNIRFGTTLRFTSNQSRNYANSYHNAVTNLSRLRGTGVDLQPGDLDPRFRTAYGDAMIAVLGLLTEVTANYNYDIQGNVQPVGAPVTRDFRNEEYESYVQDTWKISRSLTATAGLRHSLMPPVYEANGVQTSTTFSLGDWFNKRGELAQAGRSQAEAGQVVYVLANDPKGRPLYPYHKKNLAPRLSLAWAPGGSEGLARWLTGGPGKTSVRAGWGTYYDLFGQGLIRLYDSRQFGLSSTLTNPSGQLTALTAPRFSGITSMPSQLLPSAPQGGFPTPQPNNFALTNGLDDTIRPPYTINMNLSVGREFGNSARSFFVQASYLGRLSRRSLVQRDLANPTDLKDPVSGQTYFQAAKALAAYTRANAPVSSVGSIPFWENFWPAAAGNGLTATQAIYKAFKPYGVDYTSGLADIDHYGVPACSRLGCDALFNPQFSALSAWSSIGGGNYHALQLTVRKRLSQGLLFDFNYTWSKSIDLASAVERGGWFSGFILNPWSPGQMKAVSDYDAGQLWNAYAVWELPFGRSKRFGRTSNGLASRLIEGWQLSPSWFQSTELPNSVYNGRYWPTNWSIAGWATQVGKLPPTTRSKNAPAVSGRSGPNIFADPSTALAAYDYTLPGESGQRNGIRGDGAFVINLGLSKRTTLPYNEHHTLQFRCEAFNLTNTVRFDVSSASLDLGNSGSFGKYSRTLSEPRQLQFGLRYEF